MNESARAANRIEGAPSRLALATLLVMASCTGCKSDGRGVGNEGRAPAAVSYGAAIERCRERRLDTTRCFPPLKAFAGEGAGRFCLGDSSVEEPAEDCQDVGVTRVCRSFNNGSERTYRDGVLRSIRMHRGGRLAPLAFGSPQRPFTGGSFRMTTGVELGMPLSEALSKLGSTKPPSPWLDPNFGA